MKHEAVLVLILTDEKSNMEKVIFALLSAFCMAYYFWSTIESHCLYWWLVAPNTKWWENELFEKVRFYCAIFLKGQRECVDAAITKSWSLLKIRSAWTWILLCYRRLARTTLLRRTFHLLQREFRAHASPQTKYSCDFWTASVTAETRNVLTTG